MPARTTVTKKQNGDIEIVTETYCSGCEAGETSTVFLPVSQAENLKPSDTLPLFDLVKDNDASAEVNTVAQNTVAQNTVSLPASGGEAASAQQPDSSAAVNGTETLAPPVQESASAVTSSDQPSQPAGSTATVPTASGTAEVSTGNKVASGRIRGPEASNPNPQDNQNTGTEAVSTAETQPQPADASNLGTGTESSSTTSTTTTTIAADPTQPVVELSGVAVHPASVDKLYREPIPLDFSASILTEPADGISPNIIGVMHYYEAAPGETQQTTPKEMVGKRWITYSKPVCNCDNAIASAEYLSGIPCHAGVVEWDELKPTTETVGLINHALAVTVSVLRPNAFIKPAAHNDNADAFRQNLNLFPLLGMRIRLKSDFNLTGFGQKARTILNTLKVYGAIVVARGSTGVTCTDPNKHPINPFNLLINVPDDVDCKDVEDLDTLKIVANEVYLANLEVVRVKSEDFTHVPQQVARA